MKVIIKHRNTIVDTKQFTTRQECVKFIQHQLKIDKHTKVKHQYKILDNVKIKVDKLAKYVSLRSGTQICEGWANNHTIRVRKQS